MKILYLLIQWLYFDKINSLLTPITLPPTKIIPNISMVTRKNIETGTLLRPLHYDESDELEEISALICKQQKYFHEFVDEHNKSQLIEVTWNRTKIGERVVLLNLCSTENGLPLRRRCIVASNRQQAIWGPYDNKTTLIECRLTMYCQQELFHHFVIQSNGNLLKHENIWKKSKIGEISTLHDMCLKTNGLHLTRRCLYDYRARKAKWESIEHLQDFKCLQNSQMKIISNKLNYLHDNITTTNQLNRDSSTRHATTTALLTLLETPEKTLLPADVQLTSEILKNLVTEQQDVELFSDILKITHNLMSADSLTLRMSAELNATNCLLETFENYIDGLTEHFVSLTHCNLNFTTTTPYHTDYIHPTVETLNFANIGVFGHIAHNISVFYINPYCSGISGIAIYTSNLQQQQQQDRYSKTINYDSINDFHYRFIYMNESVSNLLQESHLELASYIPINMLHILSKYFVLLGRSPVVVFKVYAHDGLFVEQSLLRLRKPFSKILSISIPGYQDQLPKNFPFILRNKSPAESINTSQNRNTGCGYWNYSTWTSSGVETSNVLHHINENELILCYTNHLTQFSYLIGGGFRQDDLSDEILVTAVHQQALDIISLVGCTLSLMGLIGIWITAILFKSWRSQSSNKILLNMCVALTLQIILFLFVNTDDMSEELVKKHHYTKCVLMGAFLQYSILVLFTWMLIIAFLQFQRYVTVMGIQRPKHYILKSAVAAWSLPLIPTLFVALIDPKSYIPDTYQLITDTGICYPSGNGLYFGIILPIVLIVSANFTIFIYVFYSISHTLSKTIQRSERKLVIKQIRLSILLFFLLGLSWIFGIFAFMNAGIGFSYLFCLTATLQGFVLFIYFVILDQNTRLAWQNLLCPQSLHKTLQQKTTELQSMSTGSTSNTLDMSSTRNH